MSDIKGKVACLEALAADPGATPGERKAALRAIARLEGKTKPSTLDEGGMAERLANLEREVSRLRKEAAEKPKPEKKPDPRIYGKGSYFSESGAIIVTDSDGPCFDPVRHPDVRKVGSTAYGDWIRGRRGRQGLR